jgi:mRNA interferase RelE/StbE
MGYRIILSDLVDNQLKSLSKEAQTRITKRLRLAAENPFLFVRRLTGIDFYSLRVGDYRVILKIETDQRLVLIVRVGRRSDIYKRV